MQKLKHLLFATTLFFVAQSASAQEKTGRLYLIRSTGEVSMAVNFQVFLNDSMVCKLKNRTYSTHSMPPGKYTVYAKNMGLAIDKKSTPIEIEIKEGNSTYVDIVWSGKTYCQEITPNSAAILLKKLKTNNKCSD